jgi:osmotically-inducible protein OsmY
MTLLTCFKLSRTSLLAVTCSLLVYCFLLTACAPLLLGGAMVGGSLIVTDRRTSGAQLEDKSIEIKANQRIGEVTGDRSHVNANSYNRLVLITGEVGTAADKIALDQAILKIENVQAVVNELVVGLPASVSNRSNDTLLTSKVKASLLEAPDLQSTAFKVVTERSVVYLMGRVTEREAGRAADIARGVSGVQKVVRVFEIVSDSDLMKTLPKPAVAASAAKF